MELYFWKDSLSVGIDEIDAQHKQLIKYINELGEIDSKNTKKSEVQKIFNLLLDYTKNHFSLEEELMSKYNYPLYHEHKKAHDAFCEKLLFFYEEYCEDKPVGNKLVTYLGTWLLTHISKDDNHYAPFMKPVVEKEIKTSWFKGMLKKIWG